MERVFTNPNVVAQSWYAVARSKDVRTRQIKAVDLGKRRLVVYRDVNGGAHVADAQCPHLGASLVQGTVCHEGLRCAYHGWVFDHSGACTAAPNYGSLPKRTLQQFPVKEKWGLIWAFNGPKPAFQLPVLPSKHSFREIVSRPNRIRCHPHLVVGNGLDVNHFSPLHSANVLAVEQLERDNPYTVKLGLRLRPESWWARLITGSTNREIVADFSTTGGSIAWMNIWEPMEFHVLFTARPTPTGEAETQIVGFLKHVTPRYLWQAYGLCYHLLTADHDLLNGLNFRRAFAPADKILKHYAAQVDTYPTW